MVYSTCTFSPEENELMVEHILKKFPDLKLLPTIKSDTIADGIPQFGYDNEDLTKTSRFYFHRFNGEGYFIAKFMWTSSTTEQKKTKSKSLIKATKLLLQLLNQFTNKFLINFSLNHDIINFNTNLYMLQYNGTIPNLDQIDPIRYGLHLGEIKKTVLNLAIH